MMFPTAGIDDESTEVLVREYANSLTAQPLWAIEEAYNQARKSGATFRPTIPQFLAMVRKAAEPLRMELYEIDRVLKAKVYQAGTPEMRERVKQGFAELSAKLSADSGPRKMTAELYEQRAEQLAEHSRNIPLTLSDAARKAIGLNPLRKPEQAFAEQDYGVPYDA